MKNDDKTIRPLSELSDEELVQEFKKRKTMSHLYIVIIVLMMAFSVYNATRKGAMIFSIMPLIFMPIFVTIQKNYNAAKAEMKARNL